MSKPWPADKVERWPIGRLIPSARNARTHSEAQVAQVAASIREWGWTTPVLVDEAGTLIAGHARTLAAQKLGITEIPVMVATGWTDAQKRAYTIADNKLAINADWDMDLLRVEFGDLKLDGFNLDLMGFSGLEMADLLADRNAGLTDPDEVPEPPAEPVSRLGDVWIMGRHRLACNNSALAAPTIHEVDAVVADPPYGMKWDGKVSTGQHGHGQPKSRSSNYGVPILGDDKPFDPAPWLKYRHVVLWGWNHYASKMPVGTTLVWLKRLDESFGTYLSDAEVAWLNRGHGVYCKRDTSFRADERNRLHPAQKPVEIIRWCFEFLRDAKTILDPYAGSGTTIIAAETDGRECYAIELHPPYVDTSVLRWQNFSGGTATLEGDGRSFSEVAAERKEMAQEPAILTPKTTELE